MSARRQVVMEGFVARAEAQGLKGKARDRAALEFVLGAATYAEGEDQQSLLFIASIVAVRGYSYVKQLADEMGGKLNHVKVTG